MQETQFQTLGWEDSLGEEMATHSSILAQIIPWTEEPGGLLSMGSKELDMTKCPSMNWGIWPCPDIQMGISGLILLNRVNGYSSQYIIQKNSTKWKCRAIHSETKNFKMATTEHRTKCWALWAQGLLVQLQTREASAGCWSRCWGLCESCVLFTHSRPMQCSAGGWRKAERTPSQFWRPVCRKQWRPHLAHLRARPGECSAQLSILALSQNNELFFSSLPNWSLTTSLRAPSTPNCN